MYLGQHFLKNKNKLREIVEALDLKPEETIIEIGPGHGELTEVLAFRLEVLGQNWKIIAIEKDQQLIQNLQKKFIHYKNIEIIAGDALRLLKSKTQNLKPKTYKIVGNIPFYITGHLLRILGELKNRPSLIILTVQKEVAERICSQPFGSAQSKPRMNLLAASVQFWAKPEIIDYISQKDFRPQPKINSAIVKFKTITLSGRSSMKCNKSDKEKYYKLIKILFKQPRKTILNNLKSLIKENQVLIEKLETLQINPNDRPQNLTLDQIKKLTSLC